MQRHLPPRHHGHYRDVLPVSEVARPASCHIAGRTITLRIDFWFYGTQERQYAMDNISHTFDNPLEPVSWTMILRRKHDS